MVTSDRISSGWCDEQGPTTVAVLAERTNANPDALRRVIRSLAAVGVFTTDDEKVHLTPLGATLSEKHPQSLHGLARAEIEFHYLPFSELRHTLRTGQPAAEKYHGMPYFDWLAADPARARLFSHAMATLGAADIYVLGWVLHNWSDEESRAHSRLDRRRRRAGCQSADPRRAGPAGRSATSHQVTRPDHARHPRWQGAHRAGVPRPARQRRLHPRPSCGHPEPLRDPRSQPALRQRSSPSAEQTPLDLRIRPSSATPCTRPARPPWSRWS